MKKLNYAILILLLIFLVDTASAPANNYIPITLAPGDEMIRTLTFSGAYSRLFATADASGSASLWVIPRRIDFGAIDPGETIERDYTISVPRSQKSGYYEVIWKFSCKYTDGSSCSSPGNVVLQITVRTEPAPTSDAGRLPIYTQPIYTPPIYTSSSETTDSDVAAAIFVLIIILVLFIVGIYILVWVVKDANKRGTSGILWGIIVFFLGIIGLILYFIARPRGNIVSCNYCGKQKLETLDQCPHCKKSASPVFRPAPAPMKALRPVTPVRPEAAIDDLKKQKEKLRKIKELLEKLDERLAQGDISEGRYKELSEQYKEEAEELKNQITEKELMKEVGL